MLTWAFVAFLAAHGLVHIVIWTSTKTAEAQGTHPDRSWLIGDRHALVGAMTYLVCSLYLVAALGLAVDATWWVPMTITASGMSLLLVALFPAAIAGAWIVSPILIDLAIIALSIRAE